MASDDRPPAGILDTSGYLDLDQLDASMLPEAPEIIAITIAELHQGVTMATNPAVQAVRNEQLGAAIVEFEPLPFDGVAAARYGTLVALVIAAGRNPRPRRLDLMIAAIASANGLPLFTRNPGDFVGLGDVLTVVAV